jgi:hypothetical protein
VPPVTVAEPVPDPVRTVVGKVIVPVIVPPDNVMVKLPVILAPRVTVALNVPDPMLVKVAGPDTVYDVVPMVTVALVTVSVVDVVVAAFAMAPTKTARAQVFVIFFIFCNLLR